MSRIDPAVAGAKVGRDLALAALRSVRIGDVPTMADTPWIGRAMGDTLRREAAEFRAAGRTKDEVDRFIDAAIAAFRMIFAAAKSNVSSWWHR
jgi:hypothetical protein